MENQTFDSFYNQIDTHVKHHYPSASAYNEDRWPVSSIVIRLPSHTLDLIKKTIQNLFLWSRMEDQSTCPYYSVLMSYDFQIDLNSIPKLLEINTNASGFLISDLIQKTHGVQSNALTLLKRSFLNEWSLFSGKENPIPPQKTCIIDSNILEQKMKAEFFMFHDLIKSWNWNNEVIDISQLKHSSDDYVKTPNGDTVSFIYNRTTDFYLKHYTWLNKAYEKGHVCLTPNPKEYALLSDKRNLCSFYSKLHSSSLPSEIDKETLKQVLIRTEIMKSKEEAWNQRKSLFFKPLLGYGSKQVYRGSSITKKKMKELGPCVMQEYIPSQLWIDEQKEEWKFDIRAFAYKDELQLITGRIYKGQLTNFRDSMSGFCHIHFE